MSVLSDECTRALPQSGYRLTAPSRRELLHLDVTERYRCFFDNLESPLLWTVPQITDREKKNPVADSNSLNGLAADFNRGEAVFQ